MHTQSDCFNMCLYIKFLYACTIGLNVEGPAQVFLLTLAWLLSAFGSQKLEKWQEITLLDGNMCHLNNLKVAEKELPLPPGQLIWYNTGIVLLQLIYFQHR